MNNNEILRQLTENINSGPVDSIVESLTNYIYDTTFQVFGTTINRRQNNNTSFFKKKWFNADCLLSKREFKHARNVYLKNKNITNRQNFVSARTKYNRIKCKAKHTYKVQEGKLQYL